MAESAKESASVKEMILQLAIKVSDAELPITSLSGGNQQKVVLGKALMTQPQVVFLDEPTRGIDVGAKTDVYQLVGKWHNRGWQSCSLLQNSMKSWHWQIAFW